jgi:hypothetical protein
MARSIGSLCGAGLLVGALLWCSGSAAQTAPGSSPPAASKPGTALPAVRWDSLNAEQKLALGPIQSIWDEQTRDQQRKWLQVANRYRTMKPEEQTRLHARMSDWAKLTPEQRRKARENYKSVKGLPPEVRDAQWQNYQALPDERKQAVKDKAEAARQTSSSGSPAQRP